MSEINIAGEKVTMLEETKPYLNRNKLSNWEERLLIQRVRAGDHEAFAEIFSLHSLRVYQQAIKFVGNKVDAEDIVQEVFLLVYRKARSFRGESEFSTWLYRLTANTALTKLRQRKREKEVSLEDYMPKFREDGRHSMPVVDWSQDIDKLVAGKELRKIIQQSVDQLSPLDKAVVVMSDLEEMSNRDIGEVLGLSVQTVKARLHRARLFLREKLTIHLGCSPAEGVL
jgi:RNA polymerase sigma-70 factor (ECF subfamily)